MSARSGHGLPGPKRDSRVIDEGERFRLTSGNVALARQLLEKLLEELPRHRAAITQALQRGDLARVRTQAHTLSGGAAYCGVPAVKVAADALEHAAESGDQGLTDSRFNDLRYAMDALLDQFDES